MLLLLINANILLFYINIWCDCHILWLTFPWLFLTFCLTVKLTLHDFCWLFLTHYLTFLWLFLHFSWLILDSYLTFTWLWFDSSSTLILLLFDLFLTFFDQNLTLSVNFVVKKIGLQSTKSRLTFCWLFFFTECDKCHQLHLFWYIEW